MFYTNPRPVSTFTLSKIFAVSARIGASRKHIEMGQISELASVYTTEKQVRKAILLSFTHFRGIVTG